MSKRVNRVSYLHYVLLFALSLISVTVGVTLWLTYKQAMVVYELNTARRLEGIARTLEPYLPTDIQSLPALSAAEWAKRPPTNEMSTVLGEAAARNKVIEPGDGGSFLLLRVKHSTATDPEQTKGSKKKEDFRDFEVLASTTGLLESWWIAAGQGLPEEYRLLNGESVLIKGRNGDFAGTPGIWTAAAVPLKVEGAPGQYVLLLTANTNFHSDLSHFPWRDLVPVIVVVTLLVLALSIFFAGHIISAIWTALKALRKIAGGELSYRLSRRRGDEFGLLFRTFNNLADHLELRDKEIRRGNRLLGEALSASGAPVAVCLSSGALLYASESALSGLKISASSLPADGSGEMVSLQKRLVRRDDVSGQLTPITLPSLDEMPQDHPEMEISALWLPHEVTAPLAEAPNGAKSVKFSLIALTATNAEQLQVDGYLLVFASVENYVKPVEEPQPASA
jgi:hypothetical protein